MDPREIQWPHYKEFMAEEVEKVLSFLDFLRYDSPEHQKLVNGAVRYYVGQGTLPVATAKAIYELHNLITGR